MRKIFLTISFCLCLASAYAGAGIGVKYGSAPADSNFSEIDSMLAPQSSSITEEKAFWGFEFFMEKEAQKDALGLRLGLNKHGDTKYSAHVSDMWATFDVSITNKLYTLPIAVYYKYKLLEWLHVSAGGGATVAWGEFKDSEGGVYDEVIVFPHIAAGLELRLHNHFGIGLDLTENINAEIKRSGVTRDLSGLQTSVTARWYF